MISGFGSHWPWCPAAPVGGWISESFLEATREMWGADRRSIVGTWKVGLDDTQKPGGAPVMFLGLGPSLTIDHRTL